MCVCVCVCVQHYTYYRVYVELPRTDRAVSTAVRAHGQARAQHQARAKHAPGAHGNCPSLQENTQNTLLHTEHTLTH